MLIVKSCWVLVNLLLIVLILLRSPNEQSLQENIRSFNFFESSGSAEENIDRLISILIGCFFLFGLVFMAKSVSS